jgi:hypothetical protein
MSLYDKLNDDPRVQNCFPKFIAVVDRKHVVLAEVVSGQVYLTHEGEAFFADAAQTPVEVEVEKPTRKPRAKKAAPVEVPEVEADDLGEIPDFLDDLDVGE